MSGKKLLSVDSALVLRSFFDCGDRRSADDCFATAIAKDDEGWKVDCLVDDCCEEE